MTTTDISPALAASQGSWRAVHARDKEAWLALMADDVVIEDPIGHAPTNADGNGVRGKEAVGVFYDTIVGKGNTTITCEETFPSSSPDEIAHILTLRFQFGKGRSSSVRGVFTYRVDDAGKITNLRGYWNMDAMVFSQPETN
jgi:steroid delta-isomerase